MKLRLKLFLPIKSTSILLVLSILFKIEYAMMYLILFMLNLVLILIINSEHTKIKNDVILNGRNYIIVSLFISTILNFLVFSLNGFFRFLYFGISLVFIIIATIYTFILSKEILDSTKSVEKVYFDEIKSKKMIKIIGSNIITIISISLVYYFGIEAILKLPLLWLTFLIASVLMFNRLSYAVCIEPMITRKEEIHHYIYLVLFVISIILTIVIRNFHGKALISPIDFIIMLLPNVPYYLATGKKRKHLMN